MCIPSFIKQVVVVIAVIILGYLGINAEGNLEILYLILFLITGGIIPRYIICPKCRKPLFITKNRWYTPIFGYTCDKCGQNLLHCTIDDPNKKIEYWV